MDYNHQEISSPFILIQYFSSENGVPEKPENFLIQIFSPTYVVRYVSKYFSVLSLYVLFEQ